MNQLEKLSPLWVFTGVVACILIFGLAWLASVLGIIDLQKLEKKWLQELPR